MKINLCKVFILPVIVMLQGLSMPGQSSSQTASTAKAGNKDTGSSPRKLQAVHARKLDGFDLLPPPVDKGTQIGGASRGTGSETTLQAPRQGRTYTLHPLFQWKSNNPQKISFRFRLLASDRSTVLFQTEISDNNLKYPVEAPPLTPGQNYFWMVRPSIGLLGGESDPAEFTVMNAQQQEELKRLLNSRSEEGCAQLFIEKRLWYDAVEAYTQMISKQPSNRQLWQKRAEIYAQLPQTKEAAEQDWAKAAQIH